MEILARGVGRRKEAIAQVLILKGSGKYIINEKPAQEYLQNNTCTMLSIKAPQTILVQNLNFDKIDTVVKVKGGGLVGQAEAIKLALAKALCQIQTFESINVVENTTDKTATIDIRKLLKDKGYLTQDSRVKERRKYGLKKARKASQYHKR